MKKQMNALLSFLFVVLAFSAFSQTRTVSGNVTDESGESAIAATVKVTGTTLGTVTNGEGDFTINGVPASAQTLTISSIGYSDKVVAISDFVNAVLVSEDTVLQGVVVTDFGLKLEEEQQSYASQEISSEKLSVTQDVNLQSAIAGKVSGVQLNGQAGSKLGQAGKIRIRQVISLTSDGGPLYVVDGVPVGDPNVIDMTNVASMNVLKGPVATALYGQRAENGVIVIKTKKGSSGLSVEVNSTFTADNVAYLPKMQNLYGGGYEGQDSWGVFGTQNAIGDYPAEWKTFEGKRYLLWDNNYADESWGPKFDGKEYVPWYAWWPDSPYYGQTAKYEAQPNNIKNFYDTGLTYKNNVAISGGADKYDARLSYTNLRQDGVTPFTGLKKHFLSTTLNFQPTKKISVDLNANYTTSKIKGSFNDGYGNQTSGSFNSWFSRGVDTKKLRELKDLKTMNGFSTSWNWWGPDYYLYGGGFRKPAFWFNPNTFMEKYERTTNYDNILANLVGNYNFSDDVKLSVGVSRDQNNYNSEFYLPNELAFSAAPELYNAWVNGFGVSFNNRSENNLYSNLVIDKVVGDWEVNALFGGNLRSQKSEFFSNSMNIGANSGGLIVPDLYSFSNTSDPPTPVRSRGQKKVNSLYSKFLIGYKERIFLDATYRKDWSSALPKNRNGYGYPAFGLTYNLIKDGDAAVGPITYAKLRGGWAQVGSDVGAHLINPVYGVGNKPFDNKNVTLFSPTTLVDPNLKPALNTALEGGFDLKFYDRVNFNFTYYNEKRTDDIVSISIPRGSGYSNYLTNAGETQRKGVEITLDGDVIERKGEGDFNWNMAVNFAKGKVTVNRLPNGLKEILAPGGRSAFRVATMTQSLGDTWGQIRGTAILRDKNGNPVLQDNGLYATKQNAYLGSVLPDFTGGVFNSFDYKNFNLTASIDFQKGGRFFSLSEYWGSYSGLLEETAAINANGKNVRDPLADGGGYRVQGVDKDGNKVDKYIKAYDYFHQGRANNVTEMFMHDADFIKLREVSLGYRFPQKFVGKFAQSAQLSVVGRNLALLAVAKDNTNRWDPSELSQTYGENGQVPGTRSLGLNLNVKF